jgi:hypothetical protein
MKSYFQTICSLFLKMMSVLLLATACQSTGTDLSANEGGSSPVSEKEAVAYKKALLKCYKSGGTRVVKIMGQLRCY